LNFGKIPESWSGLPYFLKLAYPRKTSHLVRCFYFLRSILFLEGTKFPFKKGARKGKYRSFKRCRRDFLCQEKRSTTTRALPSTNCSTGTALRGKGGSGGGPFERNGQNNLPEMGGPFFLEKNWKERKDFVKPGLGRNKRVDIPPS